MNHEIMKEKVLALDDGALKPEERRLAEAHLVQCLECRKLRERWAQTAQAFFRKTSRPAASDFFVHQVMEKVLAETAPRARTVRWRQPFGWLAPLAALGMVALLFVVPAPAPVTFDALVLQETGEASSWIFSDQLPGSGELFQLIMGGE